MKPTRPCVRLAPRPQLLRRSGLPALLVLFSGCMASAAPPSVATPSPAASAAAPGQQLSATAGSAELAARWTAVTDEVGAARCTSAADCRSMPVGVKACGGPERYLAWSVRSSDETRLKQRVEAYNAARQADNLQNGRVSNCMMMMDPGAACEAGRCVTPSRGGSPLLR